MPSSRRLIDDLKQDLIYGFRMLRSKPAFTAMAVLSIALGIGATTAIFSVVYAVLIDPYPYRAADRIGQLILTTKKHPRRGVTYTRRQFLEIESRIHSMESAAAITSDQPVLMGTGLAEVVWRAHCSANFFDFFGVPPLMGREFTAEHGGLGTIPEPVAVISYKFWQRAFQGKPDILGRQIRLNQDVYTVVGVLPIRFTWMDEDVYVPMDMKGKARDDISVFYRVRPHVTDDEINAEFQPILRQFRAQAPSYWYPEGAFKVRFLSVNDGILGKFAATLMALFGAVTLLLLIACGNVANLLLARAATREAEMAIRLSIGATRMRLVRQLLTESVLLALTGGIFGIALAFAGVRAVIALMPEYSIPHEAVIAINWPVLWFALGASILTGFLFGLAPALQASQETQNEAMRASGRGASAGANRRRLHDGLIVAEITLSVVLLTGAGMAVRGLLAMEGANLGYNPQNVLTFEIPLNEARYTEWSSRLALYQGVIASLRRAPQVRAAAVSVTGFPPYSGFQTRAIMDDRPSSQAPEVELNLVQDGYFAMVRTPLLRGRDLSESDVLQARPVALITEDMAKREFATGAGPLGHHIRIDIFDQPLPQSFLKAPGFSNSFEIVGVVGDARNRGLDEPAIQAVYLPYSILLPPDVGVLARTSGDPKKLTALVRDCIRALDRNQPITSVRTLENWLDTAMAYQSFSTFLFGVFGGVGLLLSAAGVFGVVSYSVQRRTREFGIRMALGANSGTIVKAVLSGTTRVLILGLVLGVGLSIFASRALGNQMRGMGAGDPLLLALVPAILVVVTLGASLLPARSAIGIQPVEALRQE